MSGRKHPESNIVTLTFELSLIDYYRVFYVRSDLKQQCFGGSIVVAGITFEQPVKIIF